MCKLFIPVGRSMSRFCLIHFIENLFERGPEDIALYFDKSRNIDVTLSIGCPIQILGHQSEAMLTNGDPYNEVGTLSLAFLAAGWMADRVVSYFANVQQFRGSWHNNF